jgi:GT2 family glycosyltransferase
VIDFITVTKEPGRIPRLEESLRAALGPGDGANWTLQVVDGEQHDLFSGYNAGAAQSSGDTLVFLHDDVIVLGNRLAFEKPLALLADATTGFIGVIGANRLNHLGTWWGDMPQEHACGYCRGEVMVRDTDAPNVFGMNSLVWPGNLGVFGRALVVDGVFLMCRRQTFEKLGGFDAVTFQGFHFYDVDLTLRATLAGLTNYVAPIPIYHDSMGKYDDAWKAQRDKFVAKWTGTLPIRFAD